MNAFSHEMISAVTAALDAADGAGAIVLTGNQKAFSAGFDLSIMGTAPSPEAAELLNAGGEMLLKMMALPKPLIMAAPGHALALGAIVLLAGDVRIGARNEKAKIGTNEVHIGLPLPSFALPLIRSRLSPLHLTRAATLGTIYNPDDAIATGYLDMLAEPAQLEEVAVATAAKLAKLGLQGEGGAFHTTKLYERREVLETCAARLESDVAQFRGRS
jgi:enoyl-CoA hydratase